MDDGALDLALQRTHMALRRIFGDNSSYLRQLSDLTFRPGIYPTTQQAVEEAFRSGIRSLSNLLKTAEEELRLSHDEEAALSPQPSQSAASRRIFVVHGHDDALKHEVARLLTQLDLEPVILHEQPNKGRTIIEKFEDYADVSFAVVLLTPDDIAYGVGKETSTARPRARQNVVLELGFFLGRLDRHRVAALYKTDPAGELDLPSDYSGVIYIPVDDAGKWTVDLIREMQASGIEVDANRLTRR